MLSLVFFRWCFYINLPIGGVTLVLMFFFWNPAPPNRQPARWAEHIKRLDPLGTFFLVPSVVSLLLALEWGGVEYRWRDGRIIALFVVFGVLMLAFAVVQVLIPDTATIPVRVITQRSVFCSAVYSLFIGSAMMLMLYFLPIWCE